jgi:hypothetical protein
MMSASPPIADICSAQAHVRFEPIADIGRQKPFPIQLSKATISLAGLRARVRGKYETDHLCGGSCGAGPFAECNGDRPRGREASIQILLPIAAVAIGMTIFGLVFALVVPNLNS